MFLRDPVAVFDRKRTPRGRGEHTSHVHLGGLHDLLVYHEQRQGFEEGGGGVDVHRLVQESRLENNRMHSRHQEGDTTTNDSSAQSAKRTHHHE